MECPACCSDDVTRWHRQWWERAISLVIPYERWRCNACPRLFRRLDVAGQIRQVENRALITVGTLLGIRNRLDKISRPSSRRVHPASNPPSKSLRLASEKPLQLEGGILETA
jgi:hypothetical protein